MERAGDKRTEHEGVQPPCRQCNYQPIQKFHVSQHRRVPHKKQTNILAGIEDIGQLQRKVLLDTKGQYIKESYMLAGSAFIKQLQKKIMLYTKGQYVRV